MTCSLCHSPIPDTSLYCLHCGAEQGDPGWRPAPDRHRAANLVSQATAHMVRGAWGEAEDLCRQALEVDPSNFGACSLLGDINASMGRREEACRWYEIALGIHPKDSLRQKLNQLRHASLPADVAELAEMQHGSRSWVRVAVYASATLCLMLVLAALWILATSARTTGAG